MYKFCLVIIPHLLSNDIMTFICTPAFRCIHWPITKNSGLTTITFIGEQIKIWNFGVKKIFGIISAYEIMECAQGNRDSGLDMHVILKGGLENSELAF